MTRRPRGNCSLCGAMFESPEHKCAPHTEGFIGLRRIAREAVQQALTNMSDEMLAQYVYQIGREMGGKMEHRELITELVRRFRDLTELEK